MPLKQFACPRLNIHYSKKGVNQTLQVPYTYAEANSEIFLTSGKTIETRSVGCDEYDNGTKSCNLDKRACVLDDLKDLK
ncbi:hypothetical protein GOV13_01775 [Candidatus Pacearchaeota archaeon]|nr:hypothetical protein [Candidatus Pacearchaeota archaeon]